MQWFWYYRSGILLDRRTRRRYIFVFPAAKQYG
jgi:hypothetical protein